MPELWTPAKDALSPNLSARFSANVSTKDGQPGTSNLCVEYYNQCQPWLPGGVSFLQPGLPWQGVHGGGGGMHLSRWLPLQLARDLEDEGDAEFKLWAGRDPV